MATHNKYFAVIIGAGFSGTILASILARHGRDCLVVDRSQHPRFAIGESSTPTADFLLAYLAHRWDVPELAPMACFGTWRDAYPDMRCGLKRGFSYYRHTPGKPFNDDSKHSNSLLVAASATDQWSDTHWYRADVDHFLAKMATTYGADLLENTEVKSCSWSASEKNWSVDLLRDGQSMSVNTKWIIDASGFGEATSRWCEHNADDTWMRTQSSAVFAHVADLKSFSKQIPGHELEAQQFFDSDDAAQHHVTEDGWFWMLRFLDNRASIGFVQAHTRDRRFPAAAQSDSMTERFMHRVARYPSIADLMSNATITNPKGPDGKPTAYSVERMSRCRSHAFGPGWILMPVTYGFVDPLHSTGIAHALSGVCRIADALISPDVAIDQKLSKYSDDLRQEVAWFDTLVSGCYQGLPSFQRFIAFASFYFTASISFEKQLANDPSHWPDGFMNANDQNMRRVAEEIWSETLRHETTYSVPSDPTQRAAGPMNTSMQISTEKFVQSVQRAIEPWNSVGLLSDSSNNRFQHTAPPKRLALLNTK